MNNQELSLVRLTGKVSQIFFERDFYKVGLFKTDNKQSITFFGDFNLLEVNQRIELEGYWVQHKKYGQQLKVTSWSIPIPSTKEQAINFLSSGLFKGIKKARAKVIVNHLGENAIDIIKQDGVKAFQGIKGFSDKTIQRIVETVQNTFEIQEISKKLSVYGIDMKLVLKLYKEFQENTLTEIFNNPYTMMKVDGVSFEKADTIARQMGVKPNAIYRIYACINHVLNELCYNGGHSFVDEELLISRTLAVLNDKIDKSQQVEYESLLGCLYNLEDKSVMFEKSVVFPKRLYKYEEKIARKLVQLQGFRDGEALSKNDIDKHIKNYQKRNSVILAEKQREAVARLFEENVLIVTGKAGTGKTTTLKAMIDVYKEVYPNSTVLLSAPTGRASKRMEQTTGYHAETTHRMIGWRKDNYPLYNENNKLEADIIFLDEWSMGDLQLTYYILNAIEKGTKVVFFGDVNQLPSVNVGNVLKDFITAGLPTIVLNEIFRQAQDSQIIVNANRVNEGQQVLIDESKGDFYFIPRSNSIKMAETIVKSVIRFMELGFTLEDMMVLSPMKMGYVGINRLNQLLQETVNPKCPTKNEITVGNLTFREGDKVLQIFNNPEKDVYNGDLGIIQSIQFVSSSKKNQDYLITCDFDGRNVEYDKSDLAELELGYAMTIHKSQGSEAPIVLIPLTLEHKRMLARNLLYTGMTRAKQRLVLIGDMQALNYGLANNRIVERNSYLAKRIQKAFDQFYKYNQHKEPKIIRQQELF